MTPPAPCPSVHLLATLRDLESRAAKERLTLAHFVDRVGPASFSLVALCLCVPFLQPLSVGPLATAGGLTFALLGWQLLRREPALRLPVRVSRLAPGAKGWRSISRVLAWLVGFCARFSRRRLEHWTEGERGDRWTGGLILAGGLLMAVPFIAVPLNNTFPALVIAFAALARLFRDGALLFVSAFWLKVSVIYFAFLTWAALALGGAGWEHLRAWWTGAGA